MKKNTLLKTALYVVLTFGFHHHSNAQTLVAHYKFDGNINDETGNWNLSQSSGFTGTLSYVAGKDGDANGAVTGFDAPDYLETSTNFSISGNDSRTMCAWIKLDATSGFNAVVGLGEGSQYKKWSFGTTAAKARIEIQGKGFNAGTFGDLTIGTWYHVAVVYNQTDGKVELYVNGNVSNTNTWTEANTTATLLRIGNDYNNATPPQSRGFEGALDDVRIYSDALTAPQILAIYNSPTLSTDTVTTDTFKAYPNPVTNLLNFTSQEVKSVEVFSILGTKVGSSMVINDGVDFSTYSNGIYVVNCKDDEGMTIKTIKVVKK